MLPSIRDWLSVVKPGILCVVGFGFADEFIVIVCKLLLLRLRHFGVKAFDDGISAAWFSKLIKANQASGHSTIAHFFQLGKKSYDSVLYLDDAATMRRSGAYERTGCWYWMERSEK